MAEQAIETGSGRATRGKGKKRTSGRPKGDNGLSVAKRAPVNRVERWSIAKLTPYARNPRLHSPEQVSQIAASMEKFGQAQLILVDEKGEIIAGHGRVMAAESLGWKYMMVGVAVGWSKDQKQAYRIIDNQYALNATWSPELMKLELSDLRTGDFDLETLGFKLAEFDGKMFIPEFESPSDFLSDLTEGGADLTDNKDGSITATPRGISLKLDMLPHERDLVIAFLAQIRDKQQLRTTAQALVWLATEDQKKRAA